MLTILILISDIREIALALTLMTFMKELHFVFLVHINKPKFFCNVHEDNQFTIKMATSNKLTPQTQHIVLKHHHSRSHVKRTIETNYCSVEEKRADLLTKPLADAAFFRLQHMLIG